LVLLASLLMTSSVALAQPLPVLRGIVVTQRGEGRAYFEDPHTGTLAAYASGDLVGDSQIEAIYDDRVVLRRGSELVQVPLGGLAVSRPNPAAGPTIGNGQPWLDRLGIPPQAFSRAIEQALPAQDSDDNIKD